MPAAVPPRAERPYEVIVWGASGFTGGLVAEYIAGATGRTTTSQQGKLRWALAGRSASKLAQVKAKLRLNSSLVEEPAIIIADSNDVQSLQKMSAQTRVLVSTVGPFALYGEGVLAACVKTGTDYADITGESPWVYEMLQKYNEPAARSGALIVNMSGFDSMPSDLCAYLVASWLRRERHVSTGHMQGFASVKGGGVSGGTIASIMNLQETGSAGRKAADAYLLNPEAQKPPRTRPEESEQLFPRLDATTGQLTIPFVMALVNTRVVRRSLALRRSFERETDGFGPEASYNESMPVRNPIVALALWLGLAIFALMLLTPPTRWLLRLVLPKAGEGPSAATRAATTFSMRVVGHGQRPDDENRAGPLARSHVGEAVMRGGDPGYTDTAKMVSELVLLMARSREHLPVQTLVQGASAQQGLVGGFFTPSLVGGDLLVERLRQAGMSIEVGEYKGDRKSSGEKDL